jgi:hypothetical protein
MRHIGIQHLLVPEKLPKKKGSEPWEFWGAAKPVAIVCTRDRVCDARFYGDTLGLRFKLEDDYAIVFDIGGIDLRFYCRRLHAA